MRSAQTGHRRTRGTLTTSILAVTLQLALLLPSAAQKESRWTRFDDASLISNPYNDGDSFHIQAKDKHYVFRLYFVDTPETDRQVPSRVKEQAKYWDVSEERSLELGKIAAELSRSLLQTNFTVYTRFQDAKGQGHRKRYFAMIKIGEQFLSEILVERGLVRIYGASPYKLPDRRIAPTYWRHLRALEKEAKKKQKGGWKPASKANSPAKRKKRP